MSTKALSLVASLLTVILLLVLGALLAIVQLLALNGFSDREGGPALATSLACQGGGLILAALLAGRLTRRLTERFNWSKFLAAALAVLAGLLLGAVFGGLSFAAAVIVAQAIRGS
jgi:hypothetical protein